MTVDRYNLAFAFMAWEARGYAGNLTGLVRALSKQCGPINNVSYPYDGIADRMIARARNAGIIAYRHGRWMQAEQVGPDGASRPRVIYRRDGTVVLSSKPRDAVGRWKALEDGSFDVWSGTDGKEKGHGINAKPRALADSYILTACNIIVAAQ